MKDLLVFGAATSLGLFTHAKFPFKGFYPSSWTQTRSKLDSNQPKSVTAAPSHKRAHIDTEE